MCRECGCTHRSTATALKGFSDTLVQKGLPSTLSLRTDSSKDREASFAKFCIISKVYQPKTLLCKHYKESYKTYLY